MKSLAPQRELQATTPLSVVGLLGEIDVLMCPSGVELALTAPNIKALSMSWAGACSHRKENGDRGSRKQTNGSWSHTRRGLAPRVPHCLSQNPGVDLGRSPLSIISSSESGQPGTGQHLQNLKHLNNCSSNARATAAGTTNSH